MFCSPAPCTRKHGHSTGPKAPGFAEMLSGSKEDLLQTTSFIHTIRHGHSTGPKEPGFAETLLWSKEDLLQTTSFIQTIRHRRSTCPKETGFAEKLWASKQNPVPATLQHHQARCLRTILELEEEVLKLVSAARLNIPVHLNKPVQHCTRRNDTMQDLSPGEGEI